MQTPYKDNLCHRRMTQDPVGRHARTLWHWYGRCARATCP